MKKIVTFLLVLFSFLATAQRDYKTNILNFNAGLPSDFVNTLIKKDNYLFVATQRGLSFYDGYRFINHKSIKNNIYNLVSKNNIVYFYDAEKGLCSLNKFNEEAKIISPNNFSDKNANNDHYDNIFIDSKNKIWCTDVNFIKYFDSKTLKKNIFEFDKLNAENRKAITIFEALDAKIYFATYKGLFFFDAKGNKIIPHFNDFLSHLQITSAVLKANLLYLTTLDGRFLEYNLEKNKVQTLLKLSLPGAVSQMQFSNQNQKEFIIFNSCENIYQLDLENKKLQCIYNSKNIKINNVNIDFKTSNIWIATNRGLVQLNNDSTIQNITIPSKNPKNIVSIVQDYKDVIYLALENNEIWIYKKNQFTKKIVMPNGVCKNMSVYKNKILVATTNGIFSIENEMLSEIKLKNFTKNVKKVIVDKKNNLWVLPEKGIVAVFDLKDLKQKESFILNKQSFWEGNAWNDILCDTNGTIWVAGWMPKSNGILKFDYQTQLFLDIAKLNSNKKAGLFSADFYNRIAISNTNDLLFSSYGGWNRIDKTGKVNLTYHAYQQNIPSDHIEGICEDFVGNIWFSTAEGLNVYNSKTKKTIRISQIDGLLTDDLIYGFCKLKNGNIALGNENGMSIVNTKKTLEHNTIGNLKLTFLKIDGNFKDQNYDQIVLEKQNSELVLGFSDLSFANKLKVVYRYKFKDQKKWNYLGNKSELSFVKLASGNYELVIQSGDNLNNWKTDLLKIRIEVKPKFYETWWFLCICLAIVSFLVLAVNRYLLRQQKIKNNLTQELKNAEMKTLRSQMNPHFMFNTLNSINSYIIQNKSNEASKYLTMFSKLMRNILDNSKYAEITLEKEIQTLELYIQLEAVRLDHKFKYAINIDKSIDIQILKIPPLIMQPFVENAIWHGLHNKREAGNLTINIFLQDTKSILIQIIDDGIGKNAAALLKKHQTSHKSYGIEITTSRLKLLDQENLVEIIDLCSFQKKVTGTQINLKINL